MKTERGKKHEDEKAVLKQWTGKTMVVDLRLTQDTVRRPWRRSFLQLKINISKTLVLRQLKKNKDANEKML